MRERALTSASKSGNWSPVKFGRRRLAIVCSLMRSFECVALTSRLACFRKGEARFVIFLEKDVILMIGVDEREGEITSPVGVPYRFPWLRHVFAGGGYAGDKLRETLSGHCASTIEIIKRSNTAKGLELLPRRCVVERTFARLGRCRRLTKDWERSLERSTAWILVANIRLMTRHYHAT